MFPVRHSRDQWAVLCGGMSQLVLLDLVGSMLLASSARSHRITGLSVCSELPAVQTLLPVLLEQLMCF